MDSDDFDDDRDPEGSGLEDPDELLNPKGFKNPADVLDLESLLVSHGPRGPVDSTEEDESRDPDYSYEESEDDFENFINRTYVCEDCDFRWAEKIFPDRNDYPDYDDEMGRAHICPMCGSMNVSFY